MTKKKPRKRPLSINDHFRREWLFIGALWAILITVGSLMTWGGPK
jgi:hypothetical protein